MEDSYRDRLPEGDLDYKRPEDDRVSITKEEFELFQKLIKIWFHSTPKLGSYFICGDGGSEKDAHGLPELILVCPHEGINTTAIYRKEKVGRSGQ